MLTRAVWSEVVSLKESLASNCTYYLYWSNRDTPIQILSDDSMLINLAQSSEHSREMHLATTSDLA